MRCPRCYRKTKLRETIEAVGKVMRLHDCGACNRRYRTEERCIKELDIPPKTSPLSRQAERKRWHRYHQGDA